MPREPEGEVTPHALSGFDLNRSSWIRCIALVGFATVAGVLLRCTLNPNLPLGWDAVVEPFCYLGCVVCVYGMIPFRAVWVTASTRMRTTLTVLLATLIAGQLSKSTHEMYPLLAWTMYADPPPMEYVAFLEFEGITTDGEQVRIAPQDVFTSLRRYRILTWFRKKVDSCRNTEGEVQQSHRQELTKVFSIVCREWEAQNPGKSLSDAAIYLSWFKYREFEQKAKLPRNLVVRIGQREA